MIGRRAYDRRNNVKVDCMERIVFSSGSLLVFTEDNHDPAAQVDVAQGG